MTAVDTGHVGPGTDAQPEPASIGDDNRPENQPAAAEPGDAEDRPDESTTPEREPRGRHAGRLVVVSTLAAVVALVLLDILLGRLAFTTRQEHLADIYNDPTIEAGDRGAPTMVLQVEDAGVNLVVAEGAEADVLRGGPGVVTGSSLPGSGGNTVVLGRASRFGGPFDFVKDLPEGTEVVVRMRSGGVARYEVVSNDTVGGNDTSALEPTDEDTLTLVTSAGGPFDSRRTVVRAELTGLGGMGAAGEVVSLEDAAASGDTAPEATADEAPAEEASADEATEAQLDPAAGEAVQGSGDTGSSGPGSGAEPEEASDPQVGAGTQAEVVPGETPDSWDVAAPAALLMLAGGFLVYGLGLVSISELRKRHPTSTVVIVAGPAIALGIVIVLFHLDAFLPTTY